MPSARVRIAVRRSARRSSDITPLLAIVAVLSGGGAIAAGVAHRHNVARVARYQSDPECRALAVPGAARATAAASPTASASATPVAPSPSVIASPAAACTIEGAIVVGRWIRYFRTMPDYRLAIRTSDGGIDSVALEDVGDRAVWDASPEGTELVVQRFAEAGSTRRPHVTVVSAGGRATRTSWNPAWREDDAEEGMVFLGLVCVGALIALRHARRKRVGWESEVGTRADGVV